MVTETQRQSLVLWVYCSCAILRARCAFGVSRSVRVKARAHSYLVKQLLACGVGLDGKLQLCVHGGHPHIDLENTQNKENFMRSQKVPVRASL